MILITRRSSNLLRGVYEGLAYFRETFTWISYDLYSLWLFIFSDFKTILGPTSFFGITNALSERTWRTNQPEALPMPGVWCRTPHVLFWVGINLLPLVINNQRQPAAIIEDSANKPWRPMPSKRMNPTRARTWMLILYLLATASSLSLGGLKQSLALIVLGSWYNNWGGSDTNCVLRNFLNACGFVCFASGAMEVALSMPVSIMVMNKPWLLVITAVVLSSVHSQDMADQEGDLLRGRRSMPLVIGDAPSRWTIACFVLFFSWFCPAFWSLSLRGYAITYTPGALVAWRTLRLRSVVDDKTSWRLWNLWMATIYCLPMLT